jgi:hypothetical protein
MRKLAVLALVLVVFTLAIAVNAQTGAGKIEGIVADPTGSAIPGVELTLTNRDDGTASKTASDDVGRFVFGSVSPGRYVVSAFAAGFRQSWSRIRVKPGQTVPLAIVLEVGSVAETVELSSQRFRGSGPVQKDAPLLN